MKGWVGFAKIDGGEWWQKKEQRYGNAYAICLLFVRTMAIVLKIEWFEGRIARVADSRRKECRGFGKSLALEQRWMEGGRECESVMFQ
jgi:hypothetical protein